MYYNTNKESGDTLTKSKIKAKSQEELILEIFKDSIKLSASEAWKIYDKKGITPITSIRRAITNLCNDNKLFKTEEKANGLYGKKEYIYKLCQVKDNNQLAMF
jgi:hypothetical protein